jgi:hypothetical protein
MGRGLLDKSQGFYAPSLHLTRKVNYSEVFPDKLTARMESSMQRIIQRKITTIQIFSAEILWADDDAAGGNMVVEPSAPPPPVVQRAKRLRPRKKKPARGKPAIPARTSK